MNTKVEKLEHSMVKLTVEVPAEMFKKAIQKAYNKEKHKISIPGFRKGKAPQQLIERMYGPEIFYEDAANFIINDTYPAEADGTGLTFTSRPEFDVDQMEKGKDFIYTATVAVRPEVTLGNYKALEISKQEVVVTDEDVEDELKREQKKSSRRIDITDRAVMDGDTVDLDYAGKVDGEAFEGGTANGHKLTIGSGMFIPGFEEKLIGMEIGQTADIDVTFPAEYHAPELAGKDAVFTCTINGISAEELPEIDDEFAEDAGFDSLDEYKEDLRKTITERREKAAKTDRENEAVNKLVEDSQIDIPDAMKEYEVERMFEEYANQLKSQGIPIDMYLKYQGFDTASFQKTLLPQAENRISSRLVLEEVAKAENIEATDEDVEKEIAEMAKQYQMEAEKLEGMIGDYEKEQMKKDIAVQKALDFIVENAIEV
ncbi:MAG: trigger factor [Lachnospiraceae bacterium]|nr:trigger factor [Lachnospiraceae bacterium]